MCVPGSLLWWLEPILIDQVDIDRLAGAFGVQACIHNKRIVVVFEKNHKIEGNDDQQNGNDPKHNGNGGSAAQTIFDVLPLNGSGRQCLINLQVDISELLLLF